MNPKIQTFTELAASTASQLTRSYPEWTHFLDTAARLYKYPHHEQILIYAQRPDATACASFDVWNKRMNRGVQRGSKGIAIMDASRGEPRIRYVFDISDTFSRDGSRRPYLWEYREEHAEAVTAALAGTYGITDEGGLSYQLEAIAQELAGEYWEEHLADILASVPGSFLEELDELNIEMAFRDAASFSIAYTLFSRCGLDPGEHFSPTDFTPVFDFNTPDAITALGTAVSESSEQVLRQIEVVIKSYERTRHMERRELYGDQPDLPAGGGLPAARIRDGNTIDFGKIRTDEGTVSEGGTPGAVQPPDSQRETDGAPGGNRPDSEPEIGADHAGVEEVHGADGGAESPGPHEVGGADEQREIEGGGNDSGGADLSVTSSGIDFNAVGPTGLQFSHRALDKKSLPYFEDVSEKRELLLKSDALKKRQPEVAGYFTAHSIPDERISFVKSLFNNTFTEIILDSGQRVGYRAYDDVLHLWRGPYTDREQEEYLGWEDTVSAIEGMMQDGLWMEQVEPLEQLALEIGAPEKDVQDDDYIPNLFDLAGSTIPLTNEPTGEPAVFRWQLPQNIIDAALTLGANDPDSRLRIIAEFMKDKPLEENDYRIAVYNFFEQHSDRKEREKYLGHLHGTYSSYYGGNDNITYTYKELSFSHGSSIEPYAAVKMKWSKVRKRIEELIQKDKFLSAEDREIMESRTMEAPAEEPSAPPAEPEPLSEQDAKKRDILMDNTRAHFASYEAVKQAHPGDIVLFQWGDFFEMYGPDARAASMEMDIHLTNRIIPELGRVAICGIPVSSLDKFVEMLRKKHGVTISAVAENSAERQTYSLSSFNVPTPIPTLPPMEPAPLAEQSDENQIVDSTFNYRRLSQMKSDCEYFLGAGNRAEKYLWQGNIHDHIREMRRIYGLVPEKPEWLTTDEIDSYAQRIHVWNISCKTHVRKDDVLAHSTYGTRRVSAYKLLEDALNLQSTRVYDTITANGGDKRVLNAKETTLAQQKQSMIKLAFQDWIWKDPDRRQKLVRKYNEEMNCIRPRQYDGSHLVLDGMNPEIQLEEHQKNAIARAVYGGNTLFAHCVGAGKTFEITASAMEMKRLGLCSKSMIVVPNHLTQQWASEFLRLYPNANILVTTKRDFEKDRRKKFCSRIATGDYDAVIIGYSQFEKIPVSKERQIRQLNQQMDAIIDGIARAKEEDGQHFTVKNMERTKRSLELRLKKLQADNRKDTVIDFEELGIDRLFVDESDNFKNLFLVTKMQNVAGLSTSDAQKSSDMFSKTQYLDEITDYKGVIFATGTPISNSITEMFTVQRYLQNNTLKAMGMEHFDSWASRFGETVTTMELAPEGTYRPRTRFAKFFNLPELMNIFHEVADIKTEDMLNLPTPDVEFHNIVAQPSEYQREYVQELSERATAVRAGSVDPTKDNLLKITNDGRKLGLDQRLISPFAEDEPGSKLNLCVENIMKFWEEGKEEKLTQLVFSDLSTPKSDGSFSVYNDIKSKLVANGVPENEVAFIHDAETEVKKKELFAKVRSGKVRVLIGSTQKLGAGTNIQDRLIALHHLDCPWRPRDLTQREGRIKRRGNNNPLVHVFRYVTESTFDSYLFQTVEKKQQFIGQIMTSKSPARSCEDVDEAALSYAEVKALCAGDPRIKERMELDVDVAKLQIMKASHQSQQYDLEDKIRLYFPQEQQRLEWRIEGLQRDMAVLAEHPLPVEGYIGIDLLGQHFDERKKAGIVLLNECKTVKTNTMTRVGEYRGLEVHVKKQNLLSDVEIVLKGSVEYAFTASDSDIGNITHIDNILKQLPEELEKAKASLDNVKQQMESAKAEVGRPFPQEQELKDKLARIVELDIALKMKDGPSQANSPEPVSARGQTEEIGI